MQDKQYLGDGVYVELGLAAGDVVLTTSNGWVDTNRIVLEPEVLAAFQAWLNTPEWLPEKEEQ